MFVVCLSRTIFGKKTKVHVQIESEKHRGNKDTELNMVYTQSWLLWLQWRARAHAIRA